jgi:class 3 adenylate cyclase
MSWKRSPLWVGLAVAVFGTLVMAASGFLERRYVVLQSREGLGKDPMRGRRWIEWLHKHDLPFGLELTMFDWRVRQATAKAPPLAPELTLAVAGEETVQSLRLGYPLNESIGLLFPRHVYGRILRELREEGAAAVAFDVLLPDDRPDHPPVVQGGTNPPISSDEFFARQIAAQGNVILASLPDLPPAPRFRSVARALGEVHSPRDKDGAARRVRAFVDCRFYGTQLLNFATRRRLVVSDGTPGTLRLHDPADEGELVLPISTNGLVSLPLGGARIAVPAFEHRRVWHMGIALAAVRLGLDLEHPEILPDRIRFKGAEGLIREIPVDSAHTFPVDWSVSWRQVPKDRIIPLEQLLKLDLERQAGRPPASGDRFKDRLVIFGSVVSGSNLSDQGPTPLDPSDFLVSTYVNVANSLLQDRFVWRLPFAVELAVEGVLSLLAAWITWRLRTVLASTAILGLAVGYVFVASWVYVQHRLWLPIAYPLLTGLGVNHAVMLTWRLVFEQRERLRVKSVFSKIVSPEVVQELLGAERLGLDGSRREMTVLFADVRGFTEMTDAMQEAAETQAREQNLSEEESVVLFEKRAGEVLETVNLYLATIADVVKLHQGTLDKYIGDCVMAFWGAPGTNPLHAVHCVHAAIEAQQAIDQLNQRRAAMNREREAAAAAVSDGPPPQLLPLLALGTGINTGTMTVGLMGSEAHILNYTVFGREVNLASRLEGVSGRSRIVIGEKTFEHLRAHAPKFASLCKPLEPVSVKGFRQLVTAYEVDWKNAGEGNVLRSLASR